MHSVRTLFNTILIVTTIIVLSGCGGPADSSDPDRMAREKPPAHNPEATFQGRTALEYAERLDHRSAQQQLAALDGLVAMGVDGLPAREAVRNLIENIDSHDVEPYMTDILALRALAAMIAMQAPEAGALVRQRIVDPEFLDQERDYGSLIQAAMEIGISEETLAGDVLPLADSAPGHGGLLLRTGKLPGPLKESLGQELFALDHDEETTRFFLEHLAEFTFLDESEALNYVRTHIGLARENEREALATLVALGSEEALELGLEISESEFVDNPRLVARFAAAQMGADRAMERMVDAVYEADSPSAIDSRINALAIITRDLIHEANDNDDAVLDVESVQQLHIKSLQTLIEQGPSADHRIAGAQRLLRYMQINRDLELDPALDPVFDLAGDPDQRFETRMAVQQFMSRTYSTLTSRDPVYMIGRVVDLLWSGYDPETTAVAANMLANSRRSEEQAEVVIEKIHGSMDEHLDQWTVNPAAAVILSVAGISQFNRRPAREQASIAIGQLIASPASDLGYLEPHLRQRINAISNFNTNTVDGMIGLIGPTIFAEHEAMHRQFEPAAFAGVLERKPAWLRDEPEATEKWKQFLASVIAAEQPHFSTSAQTALDAF